MSPAVRYPAEARVEVETKLATFGMSDNCAYPERSGVDVEILEIADASCDAKLAASDEVATSSDAHAALVCCARAKLNESESDDVALSRVETLANEAKFGRLPRAAVLESTALQSVEVALFNRESVAYPDRSVEVATVGHALLQSPAMQSSSVTVLVACTVSKTVDDPSCTKFARAVRSC